MSGKALSASNNGDKLAKKVTQHGANFPGKMRTFPLDISMRECLQAPADFLKVHGSLVFFLSIHDCFDSSLCVDTCEILFCPPDKNTSITGWAG